MRKLYLLIFTILTTTVFSQKTEDFIYEMPYVHHFTYKEYGMNPQCWSSAQDSLGKLYVGNNKGIAIFNGVNWNKIPLIWSCSIKKLDNTIYIGSHNISYLSTDSATLQPKVNQIFIDTAKYHISGQIFQTSYKTSNSIFFSNRNNLLQIKNKQIVSSYDISTSTTFFYNNTVYIQHDSTIIGTDSTSLLGLDSLEKEVVNNIFIINNKAYILINGTSIYKADIDKNNNNKLSNIIFEYSMKNLTTKSLIKTKVVGNDMIMPLNSGGILIYNVITKKELFINKSSGTDIDIVNDIYITNNNNIIASTYNGFYLINYKLPIKYLKHNQKLKSITTSVIKYKGFLYVTTLDGLFKLKKQGASNKYSIEKLNKDFDSYIQLLIHNNKLYVSSRKGISIVENDEIKQITSDNIGFYFLFSKQYPDILYVGTANALHIYKEIDNKYKKIYSVTGLLTNVNKIVEFNNNVWFLYSNNEIAKLSIKNNEFNNMKVYNLKSNFLDVHIFENRLFVSSEEGNMSDYYDNKIDKFLPWDKFINKTKSKPQYYYMYNKIFKNNYFAVSCNNKIITKITITDSTTQFIDKPYKNIGADQYFGSYFDTTDNKFYMGGSGFILSLECNENEIPNINSYKTYIERIIVNDSILKTNNTIKKKSKIKILFSSNNIYKSDQNLYSYKLEGFDKKWSNWSKDTYASYTNLNYGDYTFKVKGKNVYDQISKNSTCSFTVEPAFYQTLIARILFIILIVILIYLIVFLNSKRLKKINRKLEKQVAKRTYEIQKQNNELEKLSIVAQKTDNAVVIYDAKGNLEWVNEGIFNSYGLTIEKISNEFGANIREISFYPKINEIVDQLYKTKKSVKYNSGVNKKTGELIWTQTTLTPILDENNNIKNIIGIDSDITEVKHAETQIKNQNTMINHSIEYAQRIQTAVLPSISELSKSVTDIFILYKPKDIVSGDFYWFYTLNNKTIVVSADCTGHGVPGGFMSMIGNTILNNIIKEKNIFEPNVILDYLNNKINAIVNKDTKTGQTDGMDVSVVLIDRTKNILEVATANQNIFLVKNNEVVDFYGDIWAIGSVFNENGQYSFTSKKYKLNEITHVYFSTDGYYDQFGGKDNKKLMKNIFIDLIRKNYKLPMETQKQVFDEFLSDWKNEAKQTDDIQLIGILV